MLVCTAGIHGNELAGIKALQSVFRFLKRENVPLKGEIIAFAGNLQALQKGKRYLDHDLNRSWSFDRVHDLQAGDLTTYTVEDHEQTALLDALQPYFTINRPVYFLDLHTTTANGIPFSCFGDTLQNRRYGRALPVPKILGLEDQLEGSLTEYLNIRGFPTMVVEGGQHNSQESIRSIEASIWLIMHHLGMLHTADFPEMSARREYLQSRTVNMPEFIEITHRHEIHPNDEFQMNDGYLNFQRISEGEYLARDKYGKIYAPFDGIILLPLYQGLGNDGFFIGKELSQRALDISSLLRKLQLDTFLPVLPGVRTFDKDQNTLVIEPEVLRSKTAGWLYLMGYRKVKKADSHYYIKKRPE